MEPGAASVTARCRPSRAVARLETQAPVTSSASSPFLDRVSGVRILPGAPSSRAGWRRRVSGSRARPCRARDQLARSSGRLKAPLLVRSGDGIEPVDPARRGFGRGSDSAASRSEIARGASVHAMLLRLLLWAMGAPCSPGTPSPTGRRESAPTIASTGPCAADAAKSDGDHQTPISVILRCALRGGILAHRRDVTPEHCERSSERARSNGSRFGSPRDTSECLGRCARSYRPSTPAQRIAGGIAGVSGRLQAEAPVRIVFPRAPRREGLTLGGGSQRPRGRSTAHTTMAWNQRSAEPHQESPACG